jgi:DNA polymerase I
VKVSFWLIDINSETKEGKTDLWLWGIDDHEERVLVIDRSYVDYFYAVVADGYDPTKVKAKIMEIPNTLAVKAEIVTRKFFGKPVNAIKVYCENVGNTAKLLRSLEGVKDVLEDDIRISMHYIVDNDLVPCSWHQVEVQEEKNELGVRADRIYIAQAPPKAFEKPDFPQLRILSFSMACYSREGSPKPDRNPVVIISTITDKGEEKQLIAGEDRNDKLLLEHFIKHVQDYDPDIIVGFGTNALDWSYLVERCRILKMKLGLDRVQVEPHTSVYGHVSLTGIASLDLEDFMNQFPEVKVETLENLADHLILTKLKKPVIIEDVDFADYWDNQQRRLELTAFSMNRARSIKGISDLVLDLALQLSILVGLPLDYVMTAAVGFRVEWFMIRQAQKIGEMVPKRTEQHYRSYAGGLVLNPRPGLHEKIAVLDFKSMYPSIMLAYNLSPDTYIGPEEEVPVGGVYEAPEVKHRFRKKPPGFYKEILTYLLGTRNAIRDKMKEITKTSVEYRVMDARQKAVKIITNAAYGYAGWTGARWYSKPVAEAASAWGRHTILTAIKLAEKAGLQVIYGDTDSLFTTYDPKKIPELEKKIEKELGLEVELDKVYDHVFFTEAKKRYAGLLPDGTIDIVGLEVIRGDWAEVAKKVQEHTLEIVLKNNSPEKAAAYVRTMIQKLKQRDVPLRDLIIWKTLTKPPREYAIKAPHVEAAKMLSAKGWKLTVGDKVGYVVLTGEGRLYSRVKPYVFARLEEVDIDYYISKQVVPAAARILEFWGITEEKLLPNEKTNKPSKNLMEFMQPQN